MKQSNEYYVQLANRCFEQSNELLRQCQCLDRFLDQAMIEGDGEAMLIFIEWKLKCRAKSDLYCELAYHYLGWHNAMEGEAS